MQCFVQSYIVIRIIFSETNIYIFCYDMKMVSIL